LTDRFGTVLIIYVRMYMSIYKYVYPKEWLARFDTVCYVCAYIHLIYLHVYPKELIACLGAVWNLYVRIYVIVCVYVYSKVLTARWYCIVYLCAYIYFTTHTRACNMYPKNLPPALVLSCIF